MFFSIIAAVDRNGLIGDEAGLPWRLPKDLQRFRAYTWGKPVVMGRRTFELIGRPLPGRLNIILTRDQGYSAPGCQVARTLLDALSSAEDYLVSVGKDEVMIIGGGKVYAEAILHWDRLYLTVVDGQFKGNTYFPVRELLRQKWRPAREPETYPADERNPHPHSFHIIERAWDAEHRLRPEENDPSQAGADSERALVELGLADILTRGTVDS